MRRLSILRNDLAILAGSLGFGESFDTVLEAERAVYKLMEILQYHEDTAATIKQEEHS